MQSSAMMRIPRHLLLTVASAGLTATLLLIAPNASQAQTIFSDNFNAETLGLSQTTLTNWTVINAATGGSVDVIGPGNFDFYPSNGNYLDLDGSTSAAGQLQTKQTFSLAPGTYTLSFDLGKNGGGQKTMVVSMGSFLNQTISDSLNYPSFVPTTLTFNVASGGSAPILFNMSNAGDQGYVIDNVVLTRLSSGSAPEPGTVALLAAGLFPVALRLRCRRA